MSNSPTWVDQIRMQPLTNSSSAPSKTSSESSYLEFNVASFNVLAESYLSPRSHPGLPPSHAAVAFDTEKRRQLLIDTLKRFCPPSDSESNTQETKLDIIALQELDLLNDEDGILPALDSWGYQVICTPTDQRRDCCAVAFDRTRFRLVKYEVVKFDDLACLYASEENNEAGVSGVKQYTTKKESDATFNTIKPNSKSTVTELTGMVRSFLRRNCAIIAHLQTIDNSNSSIQTNGQSFLVASAHLYWHPGYEYVKLCQAKYLLDRAYSMATDSTINEATTSKRIPTIICGDMNSKPGSIVHQFFVTPGADARTVAPWHYFWGEDNEVIYTEEEREGFSNDRVDGQDPIVVSDGDLIQDMEVQIKSISGDSTPDNGVAGLESQFCTFIIDEPNDKSTPANSTPNNLLGSAESINDNYNALQATLAARRNNHKSPQDYQHTTPAPTVKYMLDYTLNRFTRWLRILGIDATLETEEEEKERTKGNRIALFEHCKKEGRTLLTTSYKLLLRKDCPPGAYLLDPKSTAQLELALPRLLRTHGVELSPCVFLTRCVVCNGKIHGVFTDDEKRDVFVEQGAPDLVNSMENMEVFRCDGCGQGYWWDDSPTSSASRVFAQATKLFRLCVRGGVRIKNDNSQNGNGTKEVMGAFAFVDLKKEREYWDSEVSKQGTDLAVIDWLREDKLSNPFQLRSAYCANQNNANSPSKGPGETLPFSNVTLDFVGLLDYVFFDRVGFEQIGRLHVPTSFRDMNASLAPKGHLLPSDNWPSDHLVVGARLRLKGSTKPVTNSNIVPTLASRAAVVAHAPRCACGCVPNILSLFEMAEVRKKAREAAKVQSKTT